MNKTKTILDIPVSFGGVSIGDTTGRLGVKVDRGVLSLDQAGEYFIERRLTLSVAIGGGDDSPGQRTFWDMTEYEICSVADSKRIGVGGEVISFGLTFNLRDLDVGTLAKLSKGTGRLKVEKLGEIPHDATDTSEYDAEGASLFDDDGDDTPLLEVLTPGDAGKLAKAELETVEDLDQYTRAGNKLGEIKGIGSAAAERIQAALEAYLRRQ